MNKLIVLVTAMLVVKGYDADRALWYADKACRMHTLLDSAIAAATIMIDKSIIREGNPVYKWGSMEYRAPYWKYEYMLHKSGFKCHSYKQRIVPVNRKRSYGVRLWSV